MPLLMVLTILAIAGFQVYWISKSYEREERMLERSSNNYFGETMRSLQTAKLKLDKFSPDSLTPNRVLISGELNGRPDAHPVAAQRKDGQYSGCGDATHQRQLAPTADVAFAKGQPAVL